MKLIQLEELDVYQWHRHHIQYIYKSVDIPFLKHSTLVEQKFAWYPGKTKKVSIKPNKALGDEVFNVSPMILRFFKILQCFIFLVFSQI